MAGDVLPSGTTPPRGLAVDAIRWRLVPARDLFELTYGKGLIAGERRPGDVPVYGTNGRCGTHDTALFKGPGVVLGRKGQGPLGVEWCDSDFWVIDTAYSLTPLRPDVDLKYAYYVIKYVGLNHLKDGTSNPTLSRDSFGAQAFPLPPLDQQRAIAHILGTLDDRIELNRRMNETLESMARALFKSWFVDFDPVRAKAEGRDPGLPKEIADLFPSRLVDSDLGEIPEGWEVGPLDSVLVLQRGFDLPSTQRTSGAHPVLAASGPSGTHNEFMVRGPGVTTGRSGVLGRVFYVHDDFWPLNTSLWVKEFRHSTPAYAFHLLRGLDFGLFNAGSAVPTLNRNHVHGLPTLRPPMRLVAEFERAATTSLSRQKHNDDQSLTLAALRDTLLPRLISGELRVKDAHPTGETA
jgi:type I restriction enzyme, S subunit